MAGENIIVSFGPGNGQRESVAQSEVTEDANERHRQTDATDTALPHAEEAQAYPSTFADILPLLIAVLGAIGWTGFMVLSQWRHIQSGFDLTAIPATIAQWAAPLILIGVVWLLALRHSKREAHRFGNVARALSTESVNLETRLYAVNRELSLAREFLAAQSRDLDALGRNSADRLTQNASQLEGLIRESYAKIDAISTVSFVALENMEKLRDQLPVIASAAKDTANNIGNAGRTAHAQLEDMIGGFNRLNEFGAANDRQIHHMRNAVDTVLAELTARCEQIGTFADSRFADLATRGEMLRTELDQQEEQALVKLQARGAALSAEIAEARATFETYEAESLTSLRSRLVALRDESGVVSRTIVQGESTFGDNWRAVLQGLHDQHEKLSASIMNAQDNAINSLQQRLNAFREASSAIDQGVSEDHERLAAQLEARLMRVHEFEQQTHLRLRTILDTLDASFAEKFEQLQAASINLSESASQTTRELTGYEETLRNIADAGAGLENSLSSSLASLGEQLAAARSTLAQTDSQVSKLTVDSVRLLELVQGSARHVGVDLPEALSASENRVDALTQSAAALLATLRDSADNGAELATGIDQSSLRLNMLATELAEAQRDLTASGQAHQALLDGLRQAVAAIEVATGEAADKAREELSSAISTLQGSAVTAVSAIEHDSAARIRKIADELGEQSANAIDLALRTRMEEASGKLDQAVAQAMHTSHQAASQLATELHAVQEMVANLESRIDQARDRAADQVDGDFARRAALITESLNSNAIDIATAISSEVSDTAWAAYLRGDRGIFTRRAVTLLESGEAKSIEQMFERDEAFREHVSRYIHDFEAILRQVLSTRDGNALGVTLLSSDMGKLYVALAQGIRRLRS